MDANFQTIINNFSKAKVLVVGDIMLDRYTFGEVDRISPEAPVPILKKYKETAVLGGAANVARNVAALGARVMLAGVVGADFVGEKVQALLAEAGIDTEAVCVSRSRPTTEKHRFVTGVFQQILRVDEESAEDLTAEEESLLLSKITGLIKECDAIIISDYGKGGVTRNLAAEIIQLSKGYKKKVVVDTKPNHKHYFKGADLITPNLKEGIEMTGKNEVEEVGKDLVKLFDSDVLLTKGSGGMTIFSKEGEIKHLPAIIIDRAVDPSGAGDTVIAMAALGLAGGLSLEEIAVLANQAGGLVVQKPGTSFLTGEELIASLQKINSIASTEMVSKVWGYEKWLENNEKYCCKILAVNKGYQCSLHYHKIKDETFLVIKGHIKLESGEKVIFMKPGDFVRLKPNTHHRFTGLEDSEIIEISTHHEDSDSYRLENSRPVEELK